jgi:hypothetical protein
MFTVMIVCVVFIIIILHLNTACYTLNQQDADAVLYFRLMFATVVA